MAKIIRHNGEFAHYEPGVIYDIGVIDLVTNTRTPFYVGETSNPAERLKAHTRAGRIADDESTLVYQTIRALNDAGLAWDMQVLTDFGEEGPTDLEDEWIMKHLYSGFKLKNMKKGNANWMADREACAADMRKRSISSYRKYKEVITQEDLDSKHAEWMRKEAEQTERDRAQARAALVRQKLEEQMRQDCEEQIARDRLHKDRAEKIKAEAAARWEADRPEREARLKAEAEAKQAKEDAKQAAAQARIEAQRRKDKEPLQAQILIMQGLIQTYIQYGCTAEVLQTSQDRLTELIKLAK